MQSKVYWMIGAWGCWRVAVHFAVLLCAAEAARTAAP
jgi:hypothetical protein